MRRLFLVLFSLVTGASAYAADAPWDSGLYTYDGAGNITKIGADVYTYDRFGRLVTATAKTAVHANNEQQYEYDRYGNLTKIVTSGGRVKTDVPAVDAATNRLTGACAGPDCIRGTYDAAGNQTDGSQWDALGLMSASTLSSRNEQYVYDANDERIVVVSATKHERLYTLRDPANKVIRELTTTETGANWKWAKDSVHRGGSLVAAYLPSEGATTPHRHYHSDHLGTPRLVTDNLRHRVSTHTYFPFGEEAPGSDVSSPERLRFTAHERDTDGTDHSQDLDYMHARYYRAGAGRFLTVDPILGSPGRPQTWNRYSYTANNPMKYVDPTGAVFTVTSGLSTILDVAGEAAARLTFDQDGNVDVSGLTPEDLLYNEGALLIHELATSQNRYTYEEGTTMQTRGGTLQVLGIENLDNQEKNAFGIVKASDKAYPVIGVDGAVAINPAAQWTDAATQTRAVSRHAIAFHELAESYAKVEGNRTRGPNQGPGPHYEAVQRERVLLLQYPSFTAFPAGGDLARKQR
jgi:RHS repeat-associated protein